jgi:hypothetical protein
MNTQLLESTGALRQVVMRLLEAGAPASGHSSEIETLDNEYYGVQHNSLTVAFHHDAETNLISFNI